MWLMSLTYQTNRENCINGLELKKIHMREWNVQPIGSIVTFLNWVFKLFPI